MGNLCSVESCLRPIKIKSAQLCNMHYLRTRRGQPLDQPERYGAHKSDILRALVEDGASFAEIRRTLGVDHRTVRKYYPEYRPWPRGHSEGARAVRDMNEMLK